MFANYHTHTYHCGHAFGTEKEYVEEAVKNGLHILGFSDHNPCPFSNGFTSGHRMAVSETEHYIEELTALRESYQGKLDILIGYETEYYPKEFDAAFNHMKQYECDYLILGQHFTKNEYDGVYCGSRCDETALKQYVDQVIAGLELGVFSCVAHPDLIFYRDSAAVYQKEMSRLCEAALLYHTPLEFNLLGFREHRPYPYAPFWDIVADAGNEVIIGCDAHRTEDVGERAIYSRAVSFLAERQISPIATLQLKTV